LLLQATEENSEDPQPLRSLCQLLFEVEQWVHAAAAIEALLARDPQDAAAYHNLGTVQLRLGQPKQALESYQRSLALRPDHFLTQRCIAEARSLLVDHHCGVALDLASAQSSASVSRHCSQTGTSRVGGNSGEVVLVNYATAPFFAAQQLQNESAERFGVTTVRSFKPKDLERTDFYRRHRPVLEAPRGAGYWLWKPYFIEHVLGLLREEDVLIYADCGVQVVADLAPLIDLCRSGDGVVLFACHGHQNSTWTKRDCFILTGCDDPSYHEAEQVCGGYLVLRRSKRAIEIVQRWLHCCQNPLILTDRPNACGKPNLPGFRDHRHDQAVLSLLAQQDQLQPFRDPSQWGNHFKLPAFRTPGEWTAHPYSDSDQPWTNSQYPTLFNLHRGAAGPEGAAARNTLEAVAPG